MTSHVLRENEKTTKGKNARAQASPNPNPNPNPNSEFGVSSPPFFLSFLFFKLAPFSF